jgi:hypothetical protein
VSWHALLLFLVLAAEPDLEDEAGDGVRWQLVTRHLESEPPSFASYSSPWNERLKEERARLPGPPRR